MPWLSLAIGRIVAAVVSSVFAALAVAPATPPDPCKYQGTKVYVDTASHLLFTCEKGRAVGSWRVSLGRGGVGKEAEGDQKTPIGSYALGKPRPSVSGFGVFIPIGYPNAADRARGRTGHSVGIHGPPDGSEHPADIFEATDWTFGCIAVARLEDNEAIAAWIAKQHPATVTIE